MSQESTLTQAAVGKPTHEETSQRAQELWMQYGRPEGRDEEIWLEAERQLLAANPALSGPPVVDQEEPVTTARAQILSPQENHSADMPVNAPVAQPAAAPGPGARTSGGRATKARRNV